MLCARAGVELCGVVSRGVCIVCARVAVGFAMDGQVKEKNRDGGWNP